MFLVVMNINEKEERWELKSRRLGLSLIAFHLHVVFFGHFDWWTSKRIASISWCWPQIEVVLKLVSLSKATYRLNYKKLEELKSQLNDSMEQGYNRSSKLPYGAIMLFAKKKDDKLKDVSWLSCFKHLITIKNNYLLPWIDDLFDCLNNTHFFS